MDKSVAVLFPKSLWVFYASLSREYMQIRTAQFLTVLCRGVAFHEVGIFREANIFLMPGSADMLAVQPGARY